MERIPDRAPGGRAAGRPARRRRLPPCAARSRSRHGRSCRGAGPLREKSASDPRQEPRRLPLLLPRLGAPGAHRPGRVRARLRRPRRLRRPGVARPHRGRRHPPDPGPARAWSTAPTATASATAPGGRRPLRAAVRQDPQRLEDRRHHRLLQPPRRAAAAARAGRRHPGRRHAAAPPVPRRRGGAPRRQDRLRRPARRLPGARRRGRRPTSHGLWITPGLVDAHVHFSQTGWADGRPDSLDLRDRHPYDKTDRRPRRATPSASAAPISAPGSRRCSTSAATPGPCGSPAWAEPDLEVPHVAAAGPLLSTLDHWLNLPAERQFMLLTDADAAPRRRALPGRARARAAIKVWYIVDKDHPVEKSAPAVHAAGEEAQSAQPAADRPRHRPRRGQGGAAGGREAAGPQRRGQAGRRRVPRPREEERHDRLSHPHRLPRLLPDVPAAPSSTRPPAVDDPNGCVDPLTRRQGGRDGPGRPRRSPPTASHAPGDPGRRRRARSPPPTSSGSSTPASRSPWAPTPAIR